MESGGLEVVLERFAIPDARANKGVGILLRLRHTFSNLSG